MFAAVASSVFCFFLLVGAFARFDRKLNKSMLEFFSPKPVATEEESEGQPLKLVYRYRKTIVQVMDWAVYAVITGFILTDGFFADLQLGISCEFARDSLEPNGYTCFQGFLNLDGSSGTFALDCDAFAPPLEGYTCFRKVEYSEVDFYLAANVLGISAALLPPFIFGILLLSRLLFAAVSLVTLPLADPRMKRLTRKGLLVVQWLICFPTILYYLLLAFHDYIIGFESFTVVLFVYLQGTVHALMHQLDAEAKEAAGKEVTSSGDDI